MKWNILHNQFTHFNLLLLRSNIEAQIHVPNLYFRRYLNKSYARLEHFMTSLSKETTGFCRQWQKLVNCPTCLWLELFCYFLRLKTFLVVSLSHFNNTLLTDLSKMVKIVKTPTQPELNISWVWHVTDLIWTKLQSKLYWKSLWV